VAKVPSGQLCAALLAFASEPRENALILARLAGERGYGYILPGLLILEENATAEVLYYTTLLRRPEWVWRHVREDSSMFFFGINTPTYQARGFYIDGNQEIHFLDTPGDTGGYCLGDVAEADPTSGLEKSLVAIKATYVVMAKRVVELCRTWFGRHHARNKGLATNPVYALEEGARRAEG